MEEEKDEEEEEKLVSILDKEKDIIFDVYISSYIKKETNIMELELFCNFSAIALIRRL